MAKPKQSRELDLYDAMRRIHNYFRDSVLIQLREQDDERLKNALETVNGVMYLAEGEIVKLAAEKQPERRPRG